MMHTEDTPIVWPEKLANLGIVVLLPTYNNASTLQSVLDAVRMYTSDIIVVNDGSTDNTAEILGGYTGIQVLGYDRNRGKGHALKMGLNEATSRGFRYAITIDSDGQHYADDIPVFIREIENNPDSLLIGGRNLSMENMPGKNTFANKFSNFWFKLETGIALADTQSGYRLYPLQKIKGIRLFTRKYEFELEIIVRAAWRDIAVQNVPIRVYYPPVGERVSHFRPFRDFSRISVLNTYFVLVAFLWIWPMRFFRGMTKENIKRFIHTNITRSEESNARITWAIVLGLFFGITPLWGYQMILTALTAHLLKLNKVLALVASNISVPPVIPFMLYGSYVLGGFVLQQPVTLLFHQITLETMGSCLWQYVVGSFALALAVSAMSGVLIYTALLLFRKNK